MNKSITVIAIAPVLALILLGGCTKPAATPAAPETPTAPTAPVKPAAPDAPLPNASQGQAATGVAASASVRADGVEARAGDVSVKLPN